MNRVPLLAILPTLLVLPGCQPSVRCDDTGDTACWDHPDTGHSYEDDYTGDGPRFTFTWSLDGLNLSVEGREAGDYTLGMVETGEGGWEGEDCLPGPGIHGASGDFDICHDKVSPSHGITLATVTAPNDVRDNETTLITSDIANSGRLTAILDGVDGCWVLNDSTGYYADFVCTPLE